MNKPTYEQLEAQVKRLAAERDAVVADNVALKSAVDQTIGWIESTNGDPCDVVLLKGIKTPATDAILASLRAEGVEMFGKWAGSLGEWHRNKWVEVKATQFADNLRSKSEVQS